MVGLPRSPWCDVQRHRGASSWTCTPHDCAARKGRAAGESSPAPARTSLRDCGRHRRTRRQLGTATAGLCAAPRAAYIRRGRARPARADRQLVRRGALPGLRRCGLVRRVGFRIDAKSGARLSSRRFFCAFVSADLMISTLACSRHRRRVPARCLGAVAQAAIALLGAIVNVVLSQTRRSNASSSWSTRSASPISTAPSTRASRVATCSNPTNSAASWARGQLVWPRAAGARAAVPARQNARQGNLSHRPAAPAGPRREPRRPAAHCGGAAALPAQRQRLARTAQRTTESTADTLRLSSRGGYHGL